MSALQTVEPDLSDEIVEEVDPFVVVSSNASEAAAVLTVEPESEKDQPARDWFSGFCGAGPECADEHREFNKVGEPVRRCRYVAENGIRAPRRYLYCACSCHKDPDRAGQALVH